MTFWTYDRIISEVYSLDVVMIWWFSLQIMCPKTYSWPERRLMITILPDEVWGSGAPRGESKGPCRLPPSHVPYHLRLLWITDCVLNSVLTRATKRKACPQEGGSGTCCLDNKHTRVHFCRKLRSDCFSSHVFTQDFCPRGNHSNKCSWVVHKIFNLSSGRGSDLHVYKCFDMNEKCVWMTVKSYSV